MHWSASPHHSLLDWFFGCALFWSWVSVYGPLTNSLVELIVMTIIGIFCGVLFLFMGPVTFGPLYIMSIFSTRILYSGVPGFETDCSDGVCCRIWTICLLYMGPLFRNLVCNDSRFYKFDIRENKFYIVLILFYIYLNASQYVCRKSLTSLSTFINQ